MKFKEIKQRFKSWLIGFIAGNDPVIVNVCLLTKNVPDGMCVFLAPAVDEKNTAEFYWDKAFIVPSRNVL